MLVVFNVVAQGLLIWLLLLGSLGAGAAPVAGGSVVALFMLLFFYGRWLYPFLRVRQILGVLLLKELGVVLLLAFGIGTVALVRSILS